MKRITLPRWDRQGFVLAFTGVAVATLCFVCWRRDFEKGQWALCYLLIVTLVSSVGGVRAGLLAAMLSFLAWDFFFLPPYNTLYVRDPKDWLSLLVFLLVGMAMGLQTGRMRDREAEALARERESSLLNRLSAGLVTIASTRTMAETLLNEIQAITGASSAALWLTDADGRLGCALYAAIGARANECRRPNSLPAGCSSKIKRWDCLPSPPFPNWGWRDGRFPCRTRR